MDIQGCLKLFHNVSPGYVINMCQVVSGIVYQTSLVRPPLKTGLHTVFGFTKECYKMMLIDLLISRYSGLNVGVFGLLVSSKNKYEKDLSNFDFLILILYTVVRRLGRV